MSHGLAEPAHLLDPTEAPAVAIGVIGTGGMGLRHVENLEQRVVRARVVAVYDVDAERAARARAVASSARVLASPLALINDPAVQAVVIASPDGTHADLALACVQAGKPVLCEKPLGVTAAAALQVVTAEAAAGQRLVAIGFMRRYDPAHVAVKRAADEGAIGHPLLFKGASRERSMAPNRPLENIMSNTVIHDLDAARWMLADAASDVHEVMVFALRSRDQIAPETADLFMITLRMGARKMASIEAALSVEYGYDIEATLVGTQGVAETQQPDVALVRRNNQRGFSYPADWLERFQPAYLAEVEEWVASLHGLRPFTGASAWDGLMANLVADACAQSARTGAPVRVEPPPKPPIY